MSNYVNFLDRPQVHENLSERELKSLDKTSLTDVKDIILKFAGDSSFAPREVPATFDSELGEIDIDKEVAPEFGYDFEDAFEDSQNVDNTNIE